MTMIAADCLGVPIERVRFGPGDSAMPRAPQAGGSGLTGALGNAVQATCVNLVRAFVSLVRDDDASPLKGCRLEGITVHNGGLQITDDPTRFETYTDILTRHRLDGLTIEGESAPPGETSAATMIVQAGRFIPYTAPSTGARAPAGGYAAHFVEVHVDPDLGTVRVARVVSAVDGGRILNPKTARSQIIGGVAMGIGMALLEESVSDRTGRLATTSLAEYARRSQRGRARCRRAVRGRPRPDVPSRTRESGNSPLRESLLRLRMRSITRRVRVFDPCQSRSRRCSDSRPSPATVDHEYLCDGSRCVARGLVLVQSHPLTPKRRTHRDRP